MIRIDNADGTRTFASSFEAAMALKEIRDGEKIKLRLSNGMSLVVTREWWNQFLNGLA